MRASLLLLILLPACGALEEATGGHPPGKTRDGKVFRGDVRGAVVNDDDAPVVGATLRMTHPKHPGEVYEAETLRGGRFREDNVPPGELTITASASGYFSDQKVVTVYGSKAIHVTLKLKRTRTIRGQVTFAGIGLESVPVTARPTMAGERPQTPGPETTWTDELGEFEVGGLRQGAHELSVSIPAIVQTDDGAYLAIGKLAPVPAETDKDPILIEIPLGGRLHVNGGEGSITLKGTDLPVRRYPLPESGIAWCGLKPGLYSVQLHRRSGFKQEIVLTVKDGETTEHVFEE